jgi:hypothetical protein
MTWRQWAAGKNGRRAARLAVFTGVAVLVSGAAAVNTFPAAAGQGSRAPELAAVARAAGSGHDRPAGFWYGTDSATMTIPGPAPYHEPVIGGS